MCKGMPQSCNKKEKTGSGGGKLLSKPCEQAVHSPAGFIGLSNGLTLPEVTGLKNYTASKHKILVVDDSRIVVEYVKRILEDEETGFEVIAAYDGEEGLAKAFDELPDLIILDIVMPKMDGLDVCRKLKDTEETKLIPVIMLTSSDYPEDKIKGFETGADAYIIKPFNPVELSVRVKGIIERNLYRLKKAEYETMEALERMAEDVAHEVRNPIVAIGGFARRIKNKTPEDDKIHIYAGHIISEVERLESMVNEIVKFKTLVVSLRDFIDIKQLLDEALELNKMAVEDKAIVVEKGYLPESVVIRGDRKHLLSAFSNVIENAVEAMQTKGVLKLETGLADDMVFISVSDSGRGMTKSEIGLMFRPFYTSKMQGAGMGLPTVKHISMLHGGNVKVESQKHKGTTVTFMLPAGSRDH